MTETAYAKMLADKVALEEKLKVATDEGVAPEVLAQGRVMLARMEAVLENPKAVSLMKEM